MDKSKLSQRLGVCSWSLAPESPEDIISGLKSVGLSNIQIELGPIRDNPEVWKDSKSRLADGGITPIGGMFRTIGEDYTSLETIKRTGGVVPDEHWDANWKDIQANVPVAQSLGVQVVMFHAGFLPHDPADPEYSKLLERLARIADLYAGEGLELSFETGQETADDLNLFLDKLNRPNVGVNFDPANMILYDKGDPIEALLKLGPRIKQCHVKDATKTKVPGEWGEEVVLGTGEVDWRRFFEALDAIGFDSYLSIEREAGATRIEDIRKAKEHLMGLVR